MTATNAETKTDPRCPYCGRPVLGAFVQGSEGRYHRACIEPPVSTVDRIGPVRHNETFVAPAFRWTGGPSGMEILVPNKKAAPDAYRPGPQARGARTQGAGLMPVNWPRILVLVCRDCEEAKLISESERAPDGEVKTFCPSCGDKMVEYEVVATALEPSE